MTETATLQRWSCSVPCHYSWGTKDHEAKIVEISFDRALLAQISKVPPPKSTLAITLRPACEKVIFKGTVSYIQTESPKVLGIQFTGKVSKNLGKIQRILPFLSHPVSRKSIEDCDQRKFYRWHSSVSSGYVSGSRMIPCTTIDMSYGGARLETGEIPAMGSELELVLSSRHPHPIHAKVVSHSLGINDKLRDRQFGVEFLADTDEKRRALVPLLKRYGRKPRAFRYEFD